jgi:hypothetical protein
MDPIIPQPQNLATPELLPPHRHFLNKKFAITLVILLLLGGGAYAGIWYWQSQQVVPVSTPTAGWQTYTSNKLGYSIKYPAGWERSTTEEANSNNNGSGNFHPVRSVSKYVDVTTYFSVTLEKESLEKMREYANSRIGGQDYIESPIILDGEKGYSYRSSGTTFMNDDGTWSSLEDFYMVLIEHNGKVYDIYTQKYSLNEVKQIFSSFKFINSVAISPAPNSVEMDNEIANSRKVADLNNVRVGLELYYDNHNKFPTVAGNTPQQRWKNLSDIITKEIDFNSHPLPQDPGLPTKGYYYDYQSNSAGNEFVLKAIIQLPQPNDQTRFLNSSYDRDGTVYGLDCNDPAYCIVGK